MVIEPRVQVLDDSLLVNLTHARGNNVFGGCLRLITLKGCRLVQMNARYVVRGWLGQLRYHLSGLLHWLTIEWSLLHHG